MPARPTIYIASPLGFAATTRCYYDSVLLPAVAAAGFEALDPWGPSAAGDALTEALAIAGAVPRVAALQVANAALGEHNARLIEACAGVLAVLDGSDVDSGTAAEIGFASALPRPVIGLHTDLRQFADNEGTPVNLQVAAFIRRSGGAIARDLTAALDLLGRLLKLPPSGGDVAAMLH